MMRTHFAGQRVLYGTGFVCAAGAVAIGLVVALSLLLALALASFNTVVYAT